MEDNSTTQVWKQSGPNTPAFSTAENSTAKQVSTERLHQAYNVLNEPPAETLNNYPTSGGFSTAGKGSAIAVSKELLQQASALMQDFCAQDSGSDLTDVSLGTAGKHNSITVSEGHLQQTWVAGQAGTGFCSAGKRSAMSVSKNALKQASSLMSSEAKILTSDSDSISAVHRMEEGRSVLASNGHQASNSFRPENRSERLDPITADCSMELGSSRPPEDDENISCSANLSEVGTKSASRKADEASIDESFIVRSYTGILALSALRSSSIGTSRRMQI
jgi:hypothetical protein